MLHITSTPLRLPIFWAKYAGRAHGLSELVTARKNPYGGRMTAAVIILAAGRGRRVGGAVPKQYRSLCGKPVVQWAIDQFAARQDIPELILVIHPDHTAFLSELDLPDRLSIVPGGEERSESVKRGIDAVSSDCKSILIHDGARPLVCDGLIQRVMAALEDAPAAAPAQAVTDALWRGDDQVMETVPRDGLFRAQTPQGFHASIIQEAHAQYQGDATDDVEVARAAGIKVAIVEGDADNIKITHEADFARAERIIGMDIRLGNGYDVHRFGTRDDGRNDRVTLCGVDVPHGCGLLGHSDADVAMHALTDAIYGALAEGDIGQHFPPSEAEWKDADSTIFLRHAISRTAERGYRLNNCDITLICELPKIGPHAAAMQARLAAVMGIAPDRISVKATTSEGLGFTGRGEGIAAQATVTLVRR